jgi:helicase
VVLRDALRRPEEKSPFALLHMISRTPDMMVLQVRKGDVDRLLEVHSANVRALLLPEEERHATDELLGQLKTAQLLTEWIDEATEDSMTSAFGIGPGDLHGIVELADWLLYSASEIAKIFGVKGGERALAPLRLRVSYGVREELLPLVALRGIGRVRARNLFNKGYKALEDIRKARVEELEKVPAIGRAVAADIKKQAETSKAAA